MLDPVAWFIGNGAEHSPAVARMLAHAATGGSNGVIGFPDLRVSALDVPGTDVLVTPGGAILNNIYPGGNQQSYIARNITSTSVPITATGSAAGAVRYVILRVDDPEFGGQVPANRVTGPYVRFAVVESLTSILYPYVPLARINQPASTGTITNAMITDMRNMANPRSKREFVSGIGVPTNMTAYAWQQWPRYAPTARVPEWATYVTGAARVHSAYMEDGPTYGEWRFDIGTLQSPTTGFDFNIASKPGNGERVPTMSVSIAATIPAELRGTNVTLRTMALRKAAAIDPGFIRADPLTQVEYDLWFEERPV